MFRFRFGQDFQVFLSLCCLVPLVFASSIYRGNQLETLDKIPHNELNGDNDSIRIDSSNADINVREPLNNTIVDAFETGVILNATHIGELEERFHSFGNDTIEIHELNPEGRVISECLIN